MVITSTIYCTLSETLCLMQPYSQINVDAPYTVAFQAVGMNWAKYIVALDTLKGMTTVLLVNLIGQARYFTRIDRTHMAPPILAVINEKTGTPVIATVIMTVANSLVAFFTSLDVLANLLSISTLLARRYYVAGHTSNSDRCKPISFLMLIIVSSIASATFWAASNNRWIGYAVTVPIWFLATLGLQLTMEKAGKPELLGVPFLPWLQSACIAVNIFNVGSIDGPSFIRFIVWTFLLLFDYFFRD